MTQFKYSSLFKTDIGAIKYCFYLSIIFCIIYNISILFLVERNNAILKWWICLDSRVVNSLRTIMPAFEKVSSEMIYNGYSARISIFMEIMSSNYIITLLPLLLEIGIAIICSFIYKDIYLIFASKLNKSTKNKIGKYYNINKLRLVVGFMFIIWIFFMYSGLIFINPLELYTKDIDILFIGIFSFSIDFLGYAFVVSFFVLPFWRRWPRGV